MQLGLKIRAFLFTFLIVAGVYFFTLPGQQKACAIASDAKCGQGDAVGGRCIPSGSSCPEGYEPLTMAVCQTKETSCCIPLLGGLPPEAVRVEKGSREAEMGNVTNQQDFNATSVEDYAGKLVLMFTKNDPTKKTTSALGAASSLTAQLYSRPVASSTEYIADVFQSIKHPFGEQTAYAQGLGFSALNPVLSLWKIFRNVAYFFYVLIFMAVGIMIMLRQKIGGQAAATVQQMLPKLVISLLLVTFSYAIAGLMIDLMYISIYLMIGIFQTNGSLDNNLSIGTLTDIAFKRNIFQNVWNIGAGGVVGTVSDSIGKIVMQLLGGDNVVTKVVGGATSVLVFLIIAVALLVNIFRLFFTLLKAYASIFIGVIFAPIQLLLGTFSGQNAFIGWIKGLAKNIVVFPTVILLLFIANYFAFRPGQDAQNPAIGGFSAPQLGSNQGVGGAAAFAMLQFAIIALIPKAAELASDAVDGKMSVDPGKAMGEFAKQGFSGGEIIPGISQTSMAGLSQIPGFARIGSKTGTESGVERVILGKRSARKEELDKQQQAIFLNKTYLPKQGGLSGLLRNKSIDRQNAQNTKNTPGSSNP